MATVLDGWIGFNAALNMVVDNCLNGAYRAAYLEHHFEPRNQIVIRATRRQKPGKRDRQHEMVLTIGRPNSKDRLALLGEFRRRGKAEIRQPEFCIIDIRQYPKGRGR